MDFVKSCTIKPIRVTGPRECGLSCHDQHSHRPFSGEEEDLLFYLVPVIRIRVCFCVKFPYLAFLMNIWGSDPDSVILEPSINRKELTKKSLCKYLWSYSCTKRWMRYPKMYSDIRINNCFARFIFMHIVFFYSVVVIRSQCHFVISADWKMSSYRMIRNTYIWRLQRSCTVRGFFLFQSGSVLLQLMAVTWIKEFVGRAGRDMLPFASGKFSCL